MRERHEDPKPKDPQEIRSSDIPNAHAAGDGAMGRNDEKVDDPAEMKDDREANNKNDRTAY